MSVTLSIHHYQVPATLVLHHALQAIVDRHVLSTSSTSHVSTDSGPKKNLLTAPQTTNMNIHVILELMEEAEKVLNGQSGSQKMAAVIEGVSFLQQLFPGLQSIPLVDIIELVCTLAREGIAINQKYHIFSKLGACVKKTWQCMITQLKSCQCVCCCKK